MRGNPDAARLVEGHRRLDAIPIFLAALGVYAALGVPVAAWFLLAGVKRIDANPMTWGARVLLFPGCCALWPVLIAKSVGGKA